jgi:acetyltransferase EpsM
VADIVRNEKRYALVGFLDDVNPGRKGTPFGGATILGGREQLADLLDRNVHTIIIAIGGNAERCQLASFVETLGLELATARHPSSVIASDVTLGDGTVVAPGAIINAAAQIGRNVIINTSASVDHECLIEDGAHVGPGVNLGGRVIVRREAWVGIGSVVRDRCTIGRGSIVGAGAVVVSDVPDGVVAFGVPARVQRKV